MARASATRRRSPAMLPIVRPAWSRPFSMVYAGGLLLGNQYGQQGDDLPEFCRLPGAGDGCMDLRHLRFGQLSASVADHRSLRNSRRRRSRLAADSGAIHRARRRCADQQLHQCQQCPQRQRRATSSPRLTSVSGTGSWSILRFPKWQWARQHADIAAKLALNHRHRRARHDQRKCDLFDLQLRQRHRPHHSDARRQWCISARLEPDAHDERLGRTQWITSSNSALVPSRLTVASRSQPRLRPQIYDHASLELHRAASMVAPAYSPARCPTVSPHRSAEPMAATGWPLSTANYTHTSGLVQKSGSRGSLPPGCSIPLCRRRQAILVYGGAQVSRRLSDSLSAFASYNLQHQSIDSSLASQNAFSGFTQTFGIGITFSPRSTRLGQF